MHDPFLSSHVGGTDMRSGKKTSLAEQILALSNPQHVPEEEDETAAKVCDFRTVLLVMLAPESGPNHGECG